jgi:hypothetical protein
VGLEGRGGNQVGRNTLTPTAGGLQVAFVSCQHISSLKTVCTTHRARRLSKPAWARCFAFFWGTALIEATVVISGDRCRLLPMLLFGAAGGAPGRSVFSLLSSLRELCVPFFDKLLKLLVVFQAALQEVPLCCTMSFW